MNMDTKQKQQPGGGFPIAAVLLHLVCCGGAALLLLGGGSGLLTIGAVRGSVWLIALGFVVIVGVFAWQRIRERRARAPQTPDQG